jgi:antibiotic biosynthesis monooxygenase (ABM) superfamily enzyme
LQLAKIVINRFGTAKITEQTFKLSQKEGLSAWEDEKNNRKRNVDWQITLRLCLLQDNEN